MIGFMKIFPQKHSLSLSGYPSNLFTVLQNPMASLRVSGFAGAEGRMSRSKSDRPEIQTGQADKNPHNKHRSKDPNPRQMRTVH